MGDTEALAQLTAARVIAEQPLQHRLLEAAEDIVEVAVDRELTERLWRAVVRQADMLGLYRTAIAQRHRLEQHVFQLPHVARPMVMGHALEGLRRQFRQRTTDLPAGGIEKVLDQRCQAIEAFAQRRDMQAEHVKAVVEILTKLAMGAEFGQIDLGGADHSHVQVHLLVAAHTAEATILQKAQQLGLQTRAHLADAIEKQRAACSQLQQSELAFRARAFESTGAVAEQLGLGHGLW